MRNILYILLSAVAVCACNQKETNVEQEASHMLGEARLLMQVQRYDAARDTIESMRRRYPTAFGARTCGIVVMDSVELLRAQDSLAVIDSVLQAEQELFARLQADKSGKNYDQRTQQHLKVFHLKQHLDETGAKVKFFLRKIEIDRNNCHAEQQAL